MPTPHAVVVGGGVAGPALALLLRRIGYSVDVFDARPSSAADEGSFFNIAPNGMKVLRELGVADRLEAEGFHSEGIRFYNARGRQVGHLDSHDERARFGAENRMLKRSWLHRSLTDSAERAGADVLYNKRLLAVRTQPSGATAVFEDGTTATGDILVGCDGVRSAVRSAVFPGAPAPTFTGIVNGGGYAHLPPGTVAPGVQHMTFGRRAFFGYVARPTGEVWWFTNLPWPHEPARGELAAIPAEAWRERLLDQHGTDPDPIPRILRAATEIEVAWPDLAMPPLPTWHHGRVCLAGDAAHATPPHAGQGASLALEDALVLARSLRDEATPEAAFARYQALRKPRTERLVEQAKRTGNQKAPGPVAAHVRDLVLPLFLRLGARQAREAYQYEVPWEGAAP